MIKRLLLAAALACIPFAAQAQQTLLQGGTYTAGHGPMYSQSGGQQPVVIDSGTAAGGANGLGLSEWLQVNRSGNGDNTAPFASNGNGLLGAHNCAYDAPTTNSTGYHSLCFDANAQGGGLIAYAAGGVASDLPFTLNINGNAIRIGGDGWLSEIMDEQFGSTQGALLYRNASEWTLLDPGASGQVLQTRGTGQNPLWASTSGVGTVTSVTAGAGLSGGTITSSGTIALLSPVDVTLGGTGANSLTAHGVLLGNGMSSVNVVVPGSSGQVLQSNGASADPSWTNAGTGTVTSVTAGAGLAGGTITSTGSISLANTAVTAGTYGGASTGTSVFTVNSQGQLTAAATAQINTGGLNPAFVNGASTVAPDFTDTMLIGDASDSGNFKKTQILQALGLLKGYLNGLTLSNNVSDTNNDIDIAAGTSADSTGAYMMVLPSAITKRLDANWSVGTNQGGLDTGSEASSTWYFVYEIVRPDTGIVDALFSASATSPTLPANYTLFRRIGAIRNDGSSNIRQFVQVGSWFQWKTRVQDYAATVTGTAVLGSVATGSPTALRTLINTSIANDATGGVFTLVSSPDTDDLAPGLNPPFVTVGSGASNTPTSTTEVFTDTSAQVRVRNSSSTAVRMSISAYRDTRGME